MRTLLVNLVLVCLFVFGTCAPTVTQLSSNPVVQNSSVPVNKNSTEEKKEVNVTNKDEKFAVVPTAADVKLAEPVNVQSSELVAKNVESRTNQDESVSGRSDEQIVMESNPVDVAERNSDQSVVVHSVTDISSVDAVKVAQASVVDGAAESKSSASVTGETRQDNVLESKTYEPEANEDIKVEDIKPVVVNAVRQTYNEKSVESIVNKDESVEEFESRTDVPKVSEVGDVAASVDSSSASEVSTAAILSPTTLVANQNLHASEIDEYHSAHIVPISHSELALSSLEQMRDTSVYLSEPIERATKLLIDLEEEVKVYLSTEDVTSSPLSYSGVNNNVEEGTDRQQNQVQALIDEVNRLSLNLESTISELVSRGRYVTAAALRSVLNYLRRARISLERVQQRLNALQSATGPASASSSSASSVVASTSEGVPGYPGAQFFIAMRDRLSNITEQVSSLVNRIRASLAPTSTVAPII